MNTKHRHHVAILGLGGIGSAAFHDLACRGVDVLGIDRERPPHLRGSSHGQSRIFRVAYFEHPDYVPLAIHARKRWVEMDAADSRKIFIPTGGAWVGTLNGRHVGDSRLAADLHGLPYEILNQTETANRWPALQVPEGQVCFHEPDAGVVCPEHAIEHFIEDGERHGGQVVCGQTIQAISPEDGGVRIILERDEIIAQKVICALGAWTGSLLAMPNVRLQPTRQLLGWTRPSNPEQLAEGELPVWLFADDDQTIQYGFPLCDGLPGSSGAKVARHCEGEACDPNTVNRTISEADEVFLTKALKDRVPAAAGPLIDARVCLYTMSQDEHFVIDRHPLDERIIMACGFSGHGFKFAPAIGEGLADLALEGASRLSMNFLSSSRFKPE